MKIFIVHHKSILPKIDFIHMLMINLKSFLILITKLRKIKFS